MFTLWDLDGCEIPALQRRIDSYAVTIKHQWLCLLDPKPDQAATALVQILAMSNVLQNPGVYWLSI